MKSGLKQQEIKELTDCMLVSVFEKTSYLKAADGYVYKFTSMFDMKLCNF